MGDGPATVYPVGIAVLGITFLKCYCDFAMSFRNEVRNLLASKRSDDVKDEGKSSPFGRNNNEINRNDSGVNRSEPRF